MTRLRPSARLACAAILLLSVIVPTGAAGAELLVAAASDLVLAFREIVPAFERERGVRVRLTLGSTGQLAQQIDSGAPFDLFFAADQEYVERLRVRQRLVPGSLRPYARGLIVLATRAEGPALDALPDVLDARVKRLALANPAHAPYGRAAKEALEASGVWAAVQPKLVYGENVGQAQQFLRTGNVDAAVLALSVVRQREIRHVAIEPRLYRPLVQWAAVTAASQQPAAAAAFIQFVAHGPGRAVMERVGFRMPPWE
jgi:molybdate transport system substrate-binding protein